MNIREIVVLTGLCFALYMPAHTIAGESSTDTTIPTTGAAATNTDGANSNGGQNGHKNNGQPSNDEKMREELNYLKNVNLQMMRRIQALERRLAESGPSPAATKRQSASPTTQPLAGTASTSDNQQATTGV
ncbi:MAG TPA: hypothetical protein DCZ13_10570, partial [Porticoccaceae bacterium]|nr:hypothetical protein [Porticoccaceae bacterium]